MSTTALTTTVVAILIAGLFLRACAGLWLHKPTIALRSLGELFTCIHLVILIVGYRQVAGGWQEMYISGDWGVTPVAEMPTVFFDASAVLALTFFVAAVITRGYESWKRRRPAAESAPSKQADMLVEDVFNWEDGKEDVRV